MNEKQNDAVADLWLLTATGDLCDRARSRIAAEIKAHYADLVEVYLAAGTSLINAQLKALEDLGDAEVAARRFRKQHLTRNEEVWIQSLLELNKRWDFTTELFCLLWLLFQLSQLSHFRFKTEFGIATVFTLLLLPVGVRILAWRSKDEAGLAAALLYQTAAKIAAAGVFMAMLSLTELRISLGWPYSLMIFSFGLGQFLGAVDNFRLWRKFRREQKWPSMLLPTG